MICALFFAIYALNKNVYCFILLSPDEQGVRLDQEEAPRDEVCWAQLCRHGSSCVEGASCVEKWGSCVEKAASAVRY